MSDPQTDKPARNISSQPFMDAMRDNASRLDSTADLEAAWSEWISVLGTMPCHARTAFISGWKAGVKHSSSKPGGGE